MSSNPSQPFVPLGMNSPTGNAEASHTPSYAQQLEQLAAQRATSGVPLGMDSAVGEAEWNTFLRRRQQLLDEGMRTLGFSHQLSSSTGIPPQAAFQATSLLSAQDPNSLQNQGRPPQDQHEYQRLLGAADFYRIDNAETMDPAQLAALVEQHRQYLAGRREGDATSIGQEAYDFFENFLGVTGLGSVDATVQGLKHIPFVGDALAKWQAVQDYQRGLATLEEGFTGDMLDNERAAYEKYARPLSHFLGYAALAGTASEAVGATGFAGGIANPLVRGALQGGAVGWTMEGGGDDPISERALKIAGYAGFGAVVEWGLPKLMARLAQAFPRVADPVDPIWTRPPQSRPRWSQPLDIGEVYPSSTSPVPLSGEAAPAGILPAAPNTGAGLALGPVTPEESPLGLGPGAAPRVDRFGNPMAPTVEVAPGFTSFPRTPGQPFYPAPVHTDPISGLSYHGVISSDIDPTYGELVQTRQFRLADGRSVVADTDYQPTSNSLRVNWLGDQADGTAVKPGDLGVAAMRYIIDTMRAEFPGLEEMKGWRTSGANPEREMRISFGPSAPLSGAEAAADAANATKQGTILESPAIPAFAKQPVLEDADVAVASMASNPGQISVVRDVGDVSRTIRRFLQETIPNGVGPQDFRAVQHSIPVSVRVGTLEQGGAHFAEPGFSTYYDLQNPEARLYDTSGARILDLSQPEAAHSILQEALATRGGDPAYAAKVHNALQYASEGLMYTDAEELGLSDLARLRGYDGIRFFENDDVNKASTVNIWNYDRVRPVSRGAVSEDGVLTRTDILVGDGRAITNKVVKDYQQYGMFTGQLATTSTGQQVTISSLGPAFTQVRLPGGIEVPVPTAELMPGKASLIADAAPDAYLEFRNYAMSRMAYEAFHSGLQPAVIDWFSEELASQLPRYINEFLDLRGVEGQALRGVYTSSITEARLRDFRTLAPEEFAHADAVQQAANQELNKQAVSGSWSVSVSEAAESKGLAWSPTPHSMGGTLTDLVSGAEVPVESVEAAFRYVHDFNRELPDYSPFSVAPAELAAGPSGTANPGSSLGPEHRLTAAELSKNGQRALDRIDRMMGGGAPPFGPPGGGGGGAFEPFEGPISLPGTHETLGAQFAALRAASPLEYDALLNRFDSIALKVFEPMRNWSLNVEQMLHETGISEGRMWQNYSDVVNARAVAHNEAMPWHREINDSLNMIRRKFIRDGTVTIIGELPPDQALSAMQNAGYTEREMQGQMQLRSILEGLRQEYGVGQIMDYMPHLRARAMRGEDLGDLNRMFGGTGTFFADQVRTGAIDVREMNASVLLHRWVRAASFYRYVSAPVDAMREAWVGDPRVPLSLRQITSDWLDLVAHGHTPGQDILVPGIRHTLNAVGIPVSNAEVARGINFIMTNLYRGSLGGRPDVILRDLIGPLFGGTRIGFAPIARSYMEFFRGGATRQDMIDLALRGGWMERGMVPMGASEMFQTQMGMVPGTPTVNSTFSPAQEMIRSAASAGVDALRDAMPESLRSGIQGTKADPLQFYTKEGEFNRLISGHAGYMLMQDALATFDQARAVPEIDMTQLLGQLMRDSGADNFSGPIQRRIADLATSRQYEDAAFTFANEVANSQFRYGTAEQSLAVRSSGAVGRFGSTFGTFTTQYIAQMKEGLLGSGLAPEFGGTSVDRVTAGAKFLARQAAVAAALGLASGYTGWNFGKWYWHGSLGFGGGPMLLAFITKVQELTGRFNEAQGEPLTPLQKAALEQAHSSSGMGSFDASNLNPYAGTLRTAQSLVQTVKSANPLESTAQFLVTGKRGSGDATRFFNNAPYELAPPPPWMDPQHQFRGGGTSEQIQGIVRAGGGAVQ